MIKITQSLINTLSGESKKSPRLRVNYNLHQADSDTFQRMINVMSFGTYVQPHAHTAQAKREVFVVLSGKMAAVQFDDEGTIIDSAVLDVDGEVKAVEFAVGAWHMFIPLSETASVFEAKDGPYLKDTDKTLAPWAPREGEKGAKEYVNKILKQLKLDGIC
jgi:cupin fold WbuC family metalloprotein